MSDPTDHQIEELADRAECAHDANMSAPICKCPCHDRSDELPDATWSNEDGVRAAKARRKARRMAKRLSKRETT